MAMKQLAQQLQPLQLYSILGLTVCLFAIELVTAHGTHSLTLLLDSYHALCNIIVLSGTIITIKHGSGRSDGRLSTGNNSHEELKSLASVHNKPQMCSASHPGPERRLRNTFGWARVDVVVVLIACIFLTSLCFSVVMEAGLTLAHISHHDEMHGALLVLVLGLVSLLLNLLAYLLIGGYTFHQGSFLNKGTLVVKRPSDEKLGADDQKEEIKSEKRQGVWGICRDCTGSVVVVICAAVVLCTESQVAKFVDPALSIVSVVLVLSLSLPFMKESGFILLQTIPDHINIGSLCSQLVSTFPVIVNVHELHVWRLTGNKVYCTAHIIFLNPKEYSMITNDLSMFFLTRGITHVTVQPEFFKELKNSELLSSESDCLVQCNKDLCMDRHCCSSPSSSLESVHVDSSMSSHTHTHRHKGSGKGKNTTCLRPSEEPPLHQNGVVLAVAASCVSQLSKLHVDAEVSTEPPCKDEALVTPGTVDFSASEASVSTIDNENVSGTSNV